MRSSSRVSRHWCLEELEKHLILNSNRLGTFEDARASCDVREGEVWFSIILDSDPGDTGSRGHSDPMDVHAVKSLKGSSSPRDGCGGAHFQRPCNDRLAKANRASHGPRERAKEGVKKNKRKSKRQFKETRDAKGSHKGLKNRK